MNPWAWIAAYVVGFALLQLLFIRYISRDEDGVSLPNITGGGIDSVRSSSEATDDTVTCSACGAVNDANQGYRFCRECAEALS